MFMRNSFRRFWPLILWRLLTNRVVCLAFLTRVGPFLRGRRLFVRSPRTGKPSSADSQSAWLQVICLMDHQPTGTGLARQLARSLPTMK